MKKIKSVLENKYIYMDICYMLCIGFAVYYYYMSRSLVLHSDDAYQGVYWYHLLKAGNKAIYRLNLSLFSLVSLICYQIKGISLDLPRMVYAIFYALLVLSVMMISRPSDRKADYRCLGLIAYIMFGVSIKGVLIFQAHIDIILLAYGSYLVTESILKTKTVKKTSCLLLLFLLTWGNLSIDFIFYLLTFFPFLIVLNVIAYKEKERKLLAVDGVLICSLVMRNVIESIKEYLLPICERKAGEHYNTILFADIENSALNLKNLFYALLHMFDGYFWGENVLQFQTFFWFIDCCILLAGICLILKNCADLMNYIKKGSGFDFISVIISVSAVLIVLAYALTEIATDYTSWRYAIGIYSGIVVLIQRKIYLSDRSFKRGRIFLAGILFMLFLLPFKMEKIPDQPARDIRDQLAAFLQENNLINGFGDLWQVFYLDAVSEGNLHLIDVNYEEGKGFYEWFANLENWHHNDFNFILCDTTTPIRGITRETVTKEFGIPAQVLQFDQYEIYVYDYDISTRVVLGDDNLSDLQFDLEKERAKKKNSVRIQNCQMDAYGHYRMLPDSVIKEQQIHLIPGNYVLTVGGENLKETAIQIHPDLLADSRVTEDSDQKYSVAFTLDSAFDGRLFTLVNHSENDAMYYYYRLIIEDDNSDQADIKR